MLAKVYVITGSHACRTATLMLEHKGIPYRRIELPTGLHPLLVRACGFAGHRKPIRTVDGATHRRLLTKSKWMRAPLSRGAGQSFRANSHNEDALLRAIPPMLDKVDAWIGEGVLCGGELNVADFTIAPSLALLAYRRDLNEQLSRRPAGALVDRLLPDPTSS
jgi:glutathione S-transferase